MTFEPLLPDGPAAPGIEPAPTRSDDERRPENPTERYSATVRLIRSRLADEARTRSRPWWKFLS